MGNGLDRRMASINAPALACRDPDFRRPVGQERAEFDARNRRQDHEQAVLPVGQASVRFGQAGGRDERRIPVVGDDAEQFTDSDRSLGVDPLA